MPLFSAHARADLVLLLTSLLAAAGWVFSREALVGMPPLLFIGSRFLLASLILFLFARRDVLAPAGIGRWLKMLSTGSLFALGLMLWVHGLAYGGHMGEGGFDSHSAERCRRHSGGRDRWE